MNTFITVGCGHSESLNNFNNNAAIVNDQGMLLIDCGHTIKHALHALEMGINDVDAIFITHVHGDHVFGLERIAFETRYKYNKKVSLYFHESIYTELWDQTLKGPLGKNSEGVAKFEDYFDLHIITGDEFTVFGNHFKIFNVKHNLGKPAFGLTINDYIFFSGDTTQISEIVENIKFEVGFQDVSLTDYNPVHASLPSLIESYSEKVRNKIYLMSYQDNWVEYQNIVNANFKGFAKQGMKVNF